MEHPFHMPAAFYHADRFSLHGQRLTIRATQVRLYLTVVATVCLAFAPLWPVYKTEEGTEHHDFELGAVIAAFLFLCAFLIELWLLRRRPEKEWYDGRAVAESTKTLSWRYAVGGQPYPKDRVSAQAQFDDDIRALGTDVPSLRKAVSDDGSPTTWMNEMRSLTLEERREAYLRLRLRDQEEWYVSAAARNRSRARLWNAVLLSAEIAGVLLALSKGLTLIAVDLASVAAAVIASGVAWLAVKQHESLATAYSLASLELASVHVHLLDIADEEAWAEEVASAEEAISREHTMWRASRSLPKPERGADSK